MNVSMNEEKWDVENFRMHNEGIDKIDNDKLFSFTYYQWCAFFFLMQVRTSSLHPPLSKQSFYPGSLFHSSPADLERFRGRGYGRSGESR